MAQSRSDDTILEEARLAAKKAGSDPAAALKTLEGCLFELMNKHTDTQITGPGSSERAVRLKELAAIVNRPDGDGRTLLHDLVEAANKHPGNFDFQSTANFLVLNLGANPYLPNNLGKSPMAEAQDGELKGMMEDAIQDGLNRYKAMPADKINTAVDRTNNDNNNLFKGLQEKSNAYMNVQSVKETESKTQIPMTADATATLDKFRKLHKTVYAESYGIGATVVRNVKESFKLAISGKGFGTYVNEQAQEYNKLLREVKDLADKGNKDAVNLYARALYDQSKIMPNADKRAGNYSAILNLKGDSQPLKAIQAKVTKIIVGSRELFEKIAKKLNPEPKDNLEKAMVRENQERAKKQSVIQRVTNIFKKDETPTPPTTPKMGR